MNLADALRAAEAAYAAESQMPDDGLPVDPASVSAPTFAKSKVINVRVVERDHAALTAIAGRLGCGVSDVVRSAIHRYLRTDNARLDEVEEFLAALGDRGLRLTRSVDVSHDLPPT